MTVIEADLHDVWTKAERRAWRPVRPLSVSAWAERYRFLTAEQSSIPGPWRSANAPYLVGIMNAFQLDSVEQIVVEKAAQMGVSEALRNVMGRFAHQEPDPFLFVMPTEADGREIVSRRIRPLFHDTTVLRQLHTGVARDVRLNAITLSNGFYLRLGYAGSATSLKSHPIRFVVLDEVDDYPVMAGMPDPIALAEKRTRTYGRRRKIAYISTPTTDEGPIHRLRVRAPIQLLYYVPCPQCQRYQALVWERLKWPSFDEPEPARRAVRIETCGDVKYHCVHCPAAIDDSSRRWMVQRGAWAVESVGPALRWDEDSQNTITPAGERTAPGDLALECWPAGRQVAFHLSALYSLAVEWPTLAGEFVRLQGDPEALQDFVNQTLGEPWRVAVDVPAPDLLLQCVDDHRLPGNIPNDTLALTAGVDVQQDRLYYVVRAWGYGFRSWLIQHGMLPLESESLAALDELLARRFGGLQIDMCLIDSGYKPSLVYDYCIRTGGQHVAPSKGANSELAPPVRTVDIDRLPNGRPAPTGLKRYMINSAHWKHWVHTHIRVRAGDPGEWRLHAEVDEDYKRQILAEARVPRTKGGRLIHEWKLLNRKAGSHYLDCEVLAAAAAWFPLCVHRAGPPAAAPSSPRRFVTDPQFQHPYDPNRPWITQR